LHALNIKNPSIEPRASGHIIEQIVMIEEIIKNGFGYVVDGSVYFDVVKYNATGHYGKLSGRVFEELMSGAGEERRELEQKLANSRHERELLQHERDQLVVTSPIAGRVLTWDVGHQLLARPVERGEALITVADLSADWQLELDVPDDRIGYVLSAQSETKSDLPVRFRLSSEERAEHVGKIAEICQTANVEPSKTSRPKPTILTKVAFDTPELMKAVGGELRPGVSARAQIECGQRPLGYVWLHDIWDAAIQWWQF
jgi:multidrug efflux pump subunit AcrA (membrane-fusion protein)